MACLPPRLVAALALAACALGAAAPAGAAPVVTIDEGARTIELDVITGLPAAPRFRTFGYRWPRGVIRYVDLSPARYRAAVREAARAWNASGTGVRFVATSRARAALVVRTRRTSIVSAGCVGVAGLATTWSLGTTPVRSTVDLSPGCPPEVFRAVATHELGHVLGLDHEDRRCAIMNSVLGSGCAQPRQGWRYRCRLLEPDDLRGAASLYRGRARRATPAFCDRWPVPPKVRNLVVLPDPAGSAASALVTFRAAGRAAHVNDVVVSRRLGTCPTRIDDPAADRLERLPGGAILGAAPAAGSWCYAVFTQDEYGRTRGAATRSVFHATDAATRLGLRLDAEVVGSGVRRTIRFTSPARPAFARADVRIREGACTADAFGTGPSLDALPAPGRPVALVDEEQRTPGPTCLGLILTTAGGATTSIVRDITLENHAPTLAASWVARTCEQGGGVDVSWTVADPDGEFANVTITWGDGGDPEPAFGDTATHFYTGAGPFTVTLTARDQSDGETTRTFDVTPPACMV